MRKVPCLFVRSFEGRRIAGITSDVTPGCEWVLAGEGLATVKWDGTACMVQGGALFKRYDAKRGKTPPPGFIPCELAPDPVTLHWPGWVPVRPDDPASTWHAAAYEMVKPLADGTWELCGPHFQTNPYGLVEDKFIRHGTGLLDVPRTFDAIRNFLATFDGEGVVFHHSDGRMSKIRRDDFGMDWPVGSAATAPKAPPALSACAPRKAEETK